MIIEVIQVPNERALAGASCSWKGTSDAAGKLVGGVWEDGGCAGTALLHVADRADHEAERGCRSAGETGRCGIDRHRSGRIAGSIWDAIAEMKACIGRRGVGASSDAVNELGKRLHKLACVAIKPLWLQQQLTDAL